MSAAGILETVSGNGVEHKVVMKRAGRVNRACFGNDCAGNVTQIPDMYGRIVG